MRSRSKNFRGVFLVNRKAVLGVILLSAIPYVLSDIGRTELAKVRTSSHKVVLNAVTVPSLTVSRPAGNEAKKDRSEQAALWRMVRMRVTAYCPCRRCCGKYSDRKTASGHKIRRGDTFVAADRRRSFGTEMIVLGYNNSKPVKVLDRGRVIRGNRLDVFFDSHRKARKWGVKYLPVKVWTNQLSQSISPQHVKKIH